MPKGVLWRNADANVECFGGSRAETMEGVVAEATGGLKALLAPPFMHGAGHWMSFRTWNTGGTVYVQGVPERLDPTDIWGLVQDEQLNFLLIVGDAFARPLLDGLEHGTYDLSSLTVLLSGGAPLSANLKEEFLRHLPSLMIVDGLGSSEAGGQLSQVSAGGGATTGTFPISPGNHVLSADLDRELAAGEDELGWLAKSGRLALGYLGDAAKTERTYPVVDGVRYAVPGDRAKLRADGTIELHGRDSVTINSGGEKIFAEEVEAAIKAAPRRVRLRGRGAAERALGQRGGRGRPRPRRTHHRRGVAAGRGRAAHRPVQAAEGVRLRRRDRPLALGQGRLPLGQAGRDQLTRSPGRLGPELCPRQERAFAFLP
jgi:acyl-CoA synthetase (AMP-forming)/AMP-acid ligase II